MKVMQFAYQFLAVEQLYAPLLTNSLFSMNCTG